jgi:hypothetical protein
VLANLYTAIQIETQTPRTKRSPKRRHSMKRNLKSSLPQMPLLQDFQTLNLRSPYHLADFQPFSLELISSTRHIRAIALSFFIIGLLAITSALSFKIWQFNPDVIKENALLELAQGGFLLLAAVIQGWRAFSEQESGLKRDIRLGLALFALALFLREVDIDKLGNGAVWGALENILRAIALLMISGYVWHMSRRFKPVMHNLGRILLSPTVIVALVACLFYACGWPFDREVFKIDRGLSQWFEETLELNACLLLLCSGFAGNIKTDVVKIQAPSY